MNGSISLTRLWYVIMTLSLVLGSARANGPVVRQSWVATFGEANAHDFSEIIRLASDGSVFALGTSSISGKVLLVQRYSPNGDLQWARRYNELPTLRVDAAVLDSAGNLIVTTPIFVNGWQVAVTKLEPVAGDVVWQQNIAQPSSGLHIGVAFAGAAVDAADSIYVGGCSMLTVKLDATGRELWRAAHEPGATGRLPGDVTVDSAGNVYVSGTSLQLPGDFAVVSYDSGGNLRWSRTQGGPTGGVSGPPQLRLDAAGNVVVAAAVESACGVAGALFWKYDAAGELQWALTYPDNPCITFEPVGVAVTGNGDVLIGGFGNSGFGITRYTRDGSRVWERLFEGVSGSAQFASAFTADEDGYSYITGSEFVGAPSDYDIVTASYGPDGEFRWADSWSGSGNAGDRATDVAFDACGRVYTAGTFWGGLEDVVLIRHTQFDPRVIRPECRPAPTPGTPLEFSRIAP